MLKRTLFAFLAFVGLFMSFYSCMETDNYSDYSSLYAVMKYNSELEALVLNVPGGVFVSNDSDFSSLKDGDCVYLEKFRVYDDQPSKHYTVVENLIYKPVKTEEIEIKETNTSNNYKDSINSITRIQVSPDFYGKMFIECLHTNTESSRFDYELVYIPESTSEEAKLDTLYLNTIAANVGENRIAGDLIQRYAFDLKDFVQEHGVDSTINETKYRVATFNLKYQSGTHVVEKDTFPVYKLYNRTVEIRMYKDSILDN